MDLAAEIFSLTETLPAKEDYGLTSQIRRSSLSVSGNIAEGFGRNHSKDKMKFYYNSRGSLTETKSHLIYGRRVGYFSQSAFDDTSGLVQEIWRELNSLIGAIRREL